MTAPRPRPRTRPALPWCVWSTGARPSPLKPRHVTGRDPPPSKTAAPSPGPWPRTSRAGEPRRCRRRRPRPPLSERWPAGCRGSPRGCLIWQVSRRPKPEEASARQGCSCARHVTPDDPT
eukprot:5761391-Prymnesium_polylepis.1